MSIYRNQKGVSLVEALVGISITAAAGVAYMTHMQTVSKNEAKQKVRSSIESLNAQAIDYLKSRDVCNENAAKAFKDKALLGSQVSGDADYKALKNKGFLDASGVLQNKNIFAAGDVYDGGKVFVSDVSYNLFELTNINQASSPWNKSGKIKISVDMQTCKDGGPVVFKSPNGVITERCPVNQRQTVKKTYEKFAAFKTKPNGLIEDQVIKERRLQPDGTWKWVPVGSKKFMTCADSQDALVEAAAEYTDLKVCIAEIRTLIRAEKSGEFEMECGIKYKGFYLSGEYTSNHSFTLPAATTFTVTDLELQGAGGGGGAGGCSGFLCNAKSGKGGRAGVKYKLPSPITAVTSGVTNCTVTVGKGGGQSQAGGTSSLVCGSINLRANGGAGGAKRGNGNNNCGENGQASSYGPGSFGDCRTVANPSVAAIGAGGGGGGERGSFEAGKLGGDGIASIKLRALSIEDPNNVLDTLGLTIEDLYK